MSGHSKWSTIKRKKGELDAKKGKIYTKIGREITVAVKESGADPVSNTKLRDAIAKAKANNMPGDNINRCIKKAAGDNGGVSYEELFYEGYGPGGVAVIVSVLTDNRNRTAADVRHYFDKYGGNLGQNGCVMYMFDHKGVIVIENDGRIDEDELMLQALDAGAEDVEIQSEYFEISTSPSDFSALSKSLEDAGHVFLQAELSYLPQTQVALNEDSVKLMEKLIDMLEDNDDVQNVWHNWAEI